MEAVSEHLSEIVVPATLFGDLRTALEEEAGPLAAVHGLHAAGYAAGVAAARAFPASPDENVLALPQDLFWARLAGFFSQRGWGTLAHEPAHEAVGLLTSQDWAESAVHRGEDASCSFTAGFLSGMLSTVAGGPVSVLEVACRSRGDGRCSFAFGNALAIHDLYGKLLLGSDVPGALSAL
jgi:predicted hydrocarbon binding protein